RLGPVRPGERRDTAQNRPVGAVIEGRLCPGTIVRPTSVVRVCSSVVNRQVCAKHVRRASKHEFYLSVLRMIEAHKRGYPIHFPGCDVDRDVYELYAAPGEW